MPYHTPGVFNGLAFGNGHRGTKPNKIQPSLRNIAKEITQSYPDNTSFDYSLDYWATQGVLLINTAHTVVAGTPGSHLKLWEEFTRQILLALKNKEDVIWMLWGKDAEKYEKYILNKSHVIIKSGHPSPLNTAHPFVGSGCFLDCDIAMEKKGFSPIRWSTKLANPVNKNLMG